MLFLDPVITRYLASSDLHNGYFQTINISDVKGMKNVAFNIEQKGFLVSYLITLLILTVSRYL